MRYLLSLCMVLAMLTVPCYAQQEVPDSVQYYIEQPAVKVEDFQSMEAGELLSGIMEKAKEPIREPIRLVIALMAGIFLGAAVLVLVPGGGWSSSLEMVCVAALFGTSLPAALELVERVIQIVQEWQIYLVGFIPVFSGVMVSCGQVTQAAVYSGMFFGMAAFSTQMISVCALPLVQVYLALNTAGGLCGVPGLPQACNMLNKCVRWILTIVCMAFTAVLGMQTVLAQGADDFTINTGRLLMSGGVPIVGSVASQAMGSVLSGLRILKGSLGFAAVAVVIVQAFPLFVQCVGYYMAYTLSSAVAKSVDLGRVSGILYGMAQAVALCISFLVFFFMLIILSTALMVTLGGGG